MSAEKHIFGNLGVVKTEKKNKKDMIVAVVGCMTQQEGYDALLKQKYPYVDNPVNLSTVASSSSSSSLRASWRRWLKMEIETIAKEMKNVM